jgi:glycosyltransferase involved in cell wall biosynthesis
MPGYLGRFLDEMAGYYQEIVLFQHIPNPGENANFDYKIRSGNIRLISLPTRDSVLNRMLHARKFTKIIENHMPDLDAILFRGPTPILPPVAKVSKTIPTVILIVGDYLAGISSLPQPWWRKGLIYAWELYNDRRQLRFAQGSLVFVNSEKLYKKFYGKIKDLHLTRTTTLSKRDFFVREDTFNSQPIRLLYTGRMDPAKGLLDMVEALGILVRDGTDVFLDLVGWAEEGSDILSQIQALAEREGVAERVVFHGYKAVGPELFAYYKNADIYMIASQSSFEGFPRTLWEAMAHSLPVVATRVGSIPDFIEGAAELVPPKDPARLAEGANRLIENPNLRKEYIQKGFALASQNTLEEQVGEMAKKIRTWVEDQYG